MRKFIIVFIILTLVQLALGNAAGPPAQRAGEPPLNQTCWAVNCHNWYDLNSGSGTLSLFGLPNDGYIPGTAYTLQLVLAQATEASRWGFEITAVYEISPGQWQTAGSFTITNPTTTQLDQSIANFQYVKQTASGTFPGQTGSANWSFTWNAPASNIGTVYFYYTGCAANNGGTAFRDYVYAVNEALDIQPYPPVVSDIPDQSIYTTENFDTINLDDYIDDPDTPDSLITWTASGNVDLIIDIDPATRIATITTPSPDWVGSETVTFTAEDPEENSDSDDAVFTVELAPNFITVSLPDLYAMPGETITIPLITEEIVASDTVLGFQTRVMWDSTFGIVDTVYYGPLVPINWIPTWNLNVSGEAHGGYWFFQPPYLLGYGDLAYLNFIVDANAVVGSSTALQFDYFDFTLSNSIANMFDGSITIGSGPAQPPVVSDIPNQTIYDSLTFEPISLDDYVYDPDTPDEDITWDAAGQVDLIVTIDTDRVAWITFPEGWTGMETVTFTATDPDLLSDSDDASFEVLMTGVIRRDSELPLTFNLEQNHPNPFNPETSISFDIAKDCRVTLNIYDISGRLVSQLINSEMTAGRYIQTFSGADLTSGLYLYRLNAGDYSMTRKMILVK